MKLKYIFLCYLLFMGILSAATIQTDKPLYAPNESVVVNFSEMSAQNQDWIAIYPAGSNNDWGNVVVWDWTGDVVAGSRTFHSLPVGHYEARAFYNNSYHTESTYLFEVKDGGAESATVTTTKEIYRSDEQVVANFEQMLGDNQDWIAIYPAGSNNDWGNVVAWDWTGGTTSGSHTFNALPVGHYEVRVFFENRFHVEASHAFEVKSEVVNHASVTTNKITYVNSEEIVATFSQMLGDAEDWIAIYPAGSNNDWGNVVAWDWTGGTTSGSHTFNALPVGHYEVRVFFDNSYHTEASYAFEVTAPQVGDGTVILNEYNAVSAGSLLKNGGSDTHFGRVAGNGGAWLELVVTGEHIDLRGVNLIVKQDGRGDFKAKLPQEIQLGHLRRGTILTISQEPTDMSYAPFSPSGDDWKLNINVNDLVVQEGSFHTSSNNMSVKMVQDDGKVILLASGEKHTAVEIDEHEVFKLKRNPAYGVAPSDANYGDDANGRAYSTFGYANQWGANGEHTQDFNGLRANLNLTEVGGVVVSNIADLNEMKDAESLLYLPQNNALWIADDDAHKVFEMNLETQTLLSSYDDVQLGEFAATIDDACNRGAKRGACDIESVAYNPTNDNFYIFVGKSSSQAAIFRLTRGNINEQFHLTDYIDMGSKEYADALVIDGQLLVASGKNIYSYDYATNTRGANKLFRSPDGKIFGMAYHNGVLWLTTSTFKLIKVNWATKNVEAIYDMTKNGVWDPRGIEIINNKLHILEGMNAVGANQVLAPLGHALKNSIHIYNIP